MQQSPETRAFGGIKYTAATYSDEFTLPSFVDYLDRIEEASENMADVYASNQNAPLSQMLPACPAAYEDCQTVQGGLSATFA